MNIVPFSFALCTIPVLGYNCTYLHCALCVVGVQGRGCWMAPCTLCVVDVQGWGCWKAPCMRWAAMTVGRTSTPWNAGILRPDSGATSLPCPRLAAPWEWPPFMESESGANGLVGVILCGREGVVRNIFLCIASSVWISEEIDNIPLVLQDWLMSSHP